MKCDFIYLDWNVVKALKEKTANPFFSVAIRTLKKQFIIPFSFAHLCDLQKKMSKENMMFIEADLEFFNRLSGGYMLGRDNNDFGLKKQNILQKYNEVTISKQTQYPSFNISQEMVEKIKEVGVTTFFQDRKNVQLFPVIAMSAFSRFDCNDEVYKVIREVFSLNPPEEVAYFKELQKPDINQENLKIIVENVLNSFQPQESTLHDKMRIAYLLLDFNQSCREKINKKTNFTNIYTDSEHMLNASFAKYYITQDKKTRKKTKLVYEAYGINTEVYSIDEFIRKFELIDN